MRIICACQHEVTIPDNTTPMRLEWLENNLCPKCAAAEAAAAANELPRLQGTPKQTAWAYAVREKVHEQFREFKADYSRKKFTLTRRQQEIHLMAMLKAIRAFDKEVKAVYWIEHQDLRDIITK